jgi:ADP-ribose pyrophosphatase YjhB (NUDIX family)
MLRLRQAARAVVLDTDDRILLVRFEFPSRAVWAAPGGGIDEGETDEEAIRRELDEELGLAVGELGPWIWTREHHFPFESGLWDGQVERFVLVRTDPFVPSPRFTPEQLASEYVTGMRWWTLDELDTGDAEFAPTRLPELVAALLRDGPPAAPFDVGV